MLANADGTGERRLATRQNPGFFWGSPAWSPDGKVIAVMSIDQAAGPRLQGIEVATGKESLISDNAGAVTTSHWMPDGKGLLVSNQTLESKWRNQISYVSYPKGELYRITNDLNNYDESAISATADGKTIATVQADRNYGLWVMPAKENSTTQATQIGSGKDEGWGVDWTADGRIVTNHDLDFVVRNADGSKKETIFAGTDPNGGPAVCGHYLVISQVDVAKGRNNLFRIDLTGGASQQLTFGHDNSMPACSPDGRWVAFASTDQGKQQIFRIPIEGGTLQKLSDLQGLLPAYSLDGKFISFRNNEGTTPENYQHWIVIIPAEGGAALHRFILDPRVIGGFGNRQQFTPDGKGIASVVEEGGAGNVWVQPLDGGSPKQLTFFTSDRIDDFAFSHDGKQLALLRGRTNRDVVLIRDSGQ